jgi:hypothetical protein
MSFQYGGDGAALSNTFKHDTTVIDTLDVQNTQITDMRNEIDTLKLQVAELITLLSLINSPNPAV